MRDLLAAGENMRQAMECFARAAADSEVCNAPGVRIVNAAVGSPVFNAAFLVEPFPKDQEELESCIASAAAYYGSRGYGWSFWLLEESLEAPLRRRSRGIFRKCGLAHSADCPCMIAGVLAPEGRPAPELTYKPVTDTLTRLDFCHVTSTCFRLPFALTTLIYNCEATWETVFRGYVGYVDGRAAATAATVTSEGIIGLYSLATLPEFRRRGVAERMTRLVIRDARDGSDNQRVVLQSTGAAYWLYRRLGFEEIGNVAVYVMQ